MTSLAESTQSVFNHCAPVYLAEDKQWGSDLDIIRHSSDLYESSDVIDLGCGYAWHLANLFYISGGHIGQLVGVDYSSKMLDQAEDLIDIMDTHETSLSNKIDLYQKRISNTPFSDNSFDVSLCLNNTLGNLPPSDTASASEKREEVLSEIYRVLRPNGTLVLSVYKSSRSSLENHYGANFCVDSEASDIPSQDFAIKYQPINELCFSHRFSKPELENTLVKNGFNVTFSETRLHRIICMAQISSL